MRLFGIDPAVFRVGWRRRSRLILDSAGCPMWLAKRRCPPLSKGWGTTLQLLAYLHGFNMYEEAEDDDEQGDETL